jgi:hypothetical protein
MDEYVMKQKIQIACIEPRAPEGLIQQVILRAQAMAMGVAAQKQLETASAEKVGQLASRVMIGQLAAAAPLPKGAQPEQLAHQLERQPAFQAALRGGNVATRLNSGELLQQITGKKPVVEATSPEASVPQKEGPVV